MSIYNFVVKDMIQQDVSLEKYKGKALLIVNTATRCGFTPQYDALQALYDEYNDQGFEILDFPCNQFAAQAPEKEEDIKKMCEVNFGITFPMFAKVDVNGEHADPLFEYLKNQKKGLSGKKIKWNFTKFLVNRESEVIKRYAPSYNPLKIRKDLEKIL